MKLLVQVGLRDSVDPAFQLRSRRFDSYRRHHKTPCFRWTSWQRRFCVPDTVRSLPRRLLSIDAQSVGSIGFYHRRPSRHLPFPGFLSSDIPRWVPRHGQGPRDWKTSLLVLLGLFPIVTTFSQLSRPPRASLGQIDTGAEIHQLMLFPW